MSTITKFEREEINKENLIISPLRTTVETVFYGNNVEKITSIKKAYKLAFDSPGTVVTDIDVYKPKELGLSKDAKVLLFNDGEITGRYAPARVILGDEGVDEKKYAGIAREAAFYARNKKLLNAETYIGLHEDFIVKARLCVEEGYENTLYNWMLNFQYIDEIHSEIYKNSKKYDEGDILILSLPDYYPKGHEDGLALFDAEHNTLLLCGMRYFGEHKKGTLTLAWGTANRNGYACCHGGLKRYDLGYKRYTVGVFGLSGSGKSTLTHNRHGDKYSISILHDDAYIISTEDGSSVALEPSYFDKTQDYPMSNYSNKYLVTVQNCGVTLDENGKKVLVTEDIRNGNGRAIKSKLWTQNRINKIEEPVNAIIWLMKDSALPPILKINNATLGSALGATLATKRTAAERLKEGVDMNALVFEPYANPFRTHKLSDDYNKFKDLFEKRDVDCYILNTGFFMDKKIDKAMTLSLLEEIVSETLEYENFFDYEDIKYVKIEGFKPDFESEEYKDLWTESIEKRIDFLLNLNNKNKLEDEAIQALKSLIK